MPAELIWMLVAIVLILGLAYVVTRFVGGNIPAGTSRKARGKMICSVEQVYMGRDRQIVLVQAGDRYLLLGNTPNQITTLAEFTAEEVEAWREKEKETEGEAQRMSFSQALQKVLKQRSGRDSND